MIFGDTNWLLEAYYVKLAFGVKEECEFKLFQWHPNNLMLLQPIGEDTNGVTLDTGEYMRAVYGINGSYDIAYRRYQVVANLSDEKARDTRIELTNHGKVSATPPPSPFRERLAQGIYHLNLLTPEVEAALGVTISAHQIVEWSLGYEARKSEFRTSCQSVRSKYIRRDLKQKDSR